MKRKAWGNLEGGERSAVDTTTARKRERLLLLWPAAPQPGSSEAAGEPEGAPSTAEREGEAQRSSVEDTAVAGRSTHAVSCLPVPAAAAAAVPHRQDREGVLTGNEAPFTSTITPPRSCSSRGQAATGAGRGRMRRGDAKGSQNCPLLRLNSTFAAPGGKGGTVASRWEGEERMAFTVAEAAAPSGVKRSSGWEAPDVSEENPTPLMEMLQFPASLPVEGEKSSGALSPPAVYPKERPVATQSVPPLVDTEISAANLPPSSVCCTAEGGTGQDMRDEFVLAAAHTTTLPPPPLPNMHRGGTPAARRLVPINDTSHPPSAGPEDGRREVTIGAG